MEFQQGMTLLSAAAGALFGAGVAWGLTRNEISNMKKAVGKLEDVVKDLKKTMENEVVWQGECGQCQDKWASHVNYLSEGIGRIDRNVEQLLHTIIYKGDR